MSLSINPLILNPSIPIGRLCFDVLFDLQCLSKSCIRSPDFCIPQHDDRQLRFSFEDEEGDALDMRAAAEIYFGVSQAPNSSAALLEKRLTLGGVEFLNPSQIQITLTGPETGALPARRLHYEMAILSTAGNQRTLMYGQMTVQDTINGGI